MVAEALAIARRNAASARVRADFVQGDVTSRGELIQGKFEP